MNPGPSAPVVTAALSPASGAIPDYVLQLERSASYLPAEQIPLLRRAWEVGAAAHAGQTRKSGERTSPIRWRWPGCWPNSAWTWKR